MENLKLKIIDFFGTLIIRCIMYFEDIVDTVATVVITFVVCTVISNFFFMPVIVDGTSMNPTLKNRSLGFANIIATKISTVKRFDIVVIKLPNGDQLVKRVIGLPGETIWYLNDTLYVDGTPIEEDFLDKEYIQDYLAQYGYSQFTDDLAPVVLGEDEYFCMGDNRQVSLDSRYYGPFSSDQIVADGVYIFIK